MDQSELFYPYLFGNGEDLTSKKNYRRGYPVASLLGFEEDGVTLWSVFSKVIKPLATLRIKGSPTDSRVLYCLYERIIDTLRPTFKEGVRSIILVSPPKTTFSRHFREHVTKHHSWLVRGDTQVAFAELPGAASTLTQVTALAKNPDFKKITDEATTEETTNLLDLLETKLNAEGPRDIVLYSVQEAETAIIYSKGNIKPEYLLLTEKFLAEYSNKGRIHKLLQVATNKRVKTRIVKADSPAGKRLSQLGGLVCLLQPS